ncbi:reverse transcriptase [Corchorus capsularis]|uniref:Reverse transcriptase n=1 Tax=Corchorus capsularis TaxID=210143 RepID=A0A1R3J0D7_COCAP|nr:reverse transcriptase [Corchorus capsularis]
MAAAELSNLCSQLSLQEGEKPKVVISQDLLEEGDGGAQFFSLIGKFFTEKKANLEGMRTTLFNAWKLQMGLIVKEVGEKIYMFQFKDEAERDRVLVTQPWHFNRILLVLKKYDGVEKPEEVDFTFCPFWVRIFDLLPIMMTAKVGAAVGELIGPVLEVDEQWGEVEFRYESMPDICLVCGMFDHISENDCPVATEMRLKLGRVIRRFTPWIRAESPRFKPSRLNGGDGSFRLSDSASRRLSLLSVASGSSFHSVRGGRDLQPSPSVGDNRRSNRPHVDSMVLRGKQVARALFSDDESCEILSRQPRNEGPRIADQDELVGAVAKRVETVAQRVEPTQSYTDEADELYGDLGLDLATGIGPSTLGLGGSRQPHNGSGLNKMNNMGSVLGNEIPGIEQFRLGLGDIAAGLDNSVPKEGVLSTQNLALLQNDQVRQLLADLAAASPSFVFGATTSTSSPSRRVRKWKKAARASQSTSLNLVAGQSNVKEGRKRLSGSSILMPNTGGLVKRSREHAMEVGSTQSAGQDVEGLAPYLAGNSGKDVATKQENVRTVSEMDWIRSRLGFDYCFAVDCNGRSGGLAFLWMADNNVSLLSYSFFHIDVCIGSSDIDKWRFTGFYGRPETYKRHESWALLRSLCDRYSIPWLCAGDFNELISSAEKEGGALRSSRQMDLFKSVIDYCGFHELPVVGPLMTWHRRIKGELVFERLDRSFATESWWRKFGSSFEKHLISSASDHLPLLISISSRTQVFSKRKRSFKFEDMWCSHENFEKIVKDSWCSSSQEIASKLADCSLALEQWNKTEFGNLQCNIAYKKKEYELLYADYGAGSMVQFEKCKLELDKLYRREELLWRQRSKALWLKEDMISRLDASFTAKEVKEAVFQMSCSKAPGPDGFSPGFYQRCWLIVGADVTCFVLDFLNNGETQSAFVPDRMIYDNAMISFETVHFMRNKRTGRQAHMALKLDLSKAYDRVEWTFLEETMRVMGFPIKWVSLVMKCVRSVSYSVIVNDEQCQRFIPSRGLWQGDPLSPYLFVLCMEVFSSMIESANGTAEYFSTGHFMEARLGSNPSFVWRSLLAVRKVIEEGSRWRVGSGNLDVWEDCWVDNLNSCRPLPRIDTHKPSIRVADLIDFENRSWNIDMVLNTFEKEDAWRILSLAIPRQPVPDRLIWNDNKLGCFSVRSAYYMARRLLGRDVMPIGSRLPIWKYIWSASVPPKIKYFAWRLVWNILPAKNILRHRGLDVSDNCEVCVEVETSIYHVFFGCRFSELVWESVCLWVPICLEQWDSETDFWNYFVDKAATVGHLDKALYVLWALRYNRNRSMHDSTCSTPAALVKLVVSMEAQVANAIGVNIVDNLSKHKQVEWNPPPPGILKINSDASCCAARGEAGLGVVIRNSNGEVVVSGSRKLYFVSDPLYAEVHAILFGFELALEYGVDDCMFESDSLSAITEIKKHGLSFWEGGVLIDEIRDLATLFDKCTFHFVNREANDLAHRIASLGLDDVWCGSVPPSVL